MAKTAEINIRCEDDEKSELIRLASADGSALGPWMVRKCLARTPTIDMEAIITKPDDVMTIEPTTRDYVRHLQDVTRSTKLRIRDPIFPKPISPTRDQQAQRLLEIARDHEPHPLEFPETEFEKDGTSGGVLKIRLPPPVKVVSVSPLEKLQKSVPELTVASKLPNWQDERRAVPGSLLKKVKGL